MSGGKILFKAENLTEKDATFSDGRQEVVSERFSSIEDMVTAKICGTAKDSFDIDFVLRSFNEKGTARILYTEKKACLYGKEFSFEYSFDPVHHAVYSEALSFEVAVLFPEGKDFCIADFNISEPVIENTVCDFVGKDVITYNERGEKCVFVKQLDGSRILCPIIPKKVVFLGNSLLFGMWKMYGMCATEKDKDYYHYITNYILKYNKDCVFSKLYSSYFEKAESVADFDEWFYVDTQQSNNGEKISAASILTEDTELLIVQLGDNVGCDGVYFDKNSELFVERVKKMCPRARIIFVFGWYGPSPNVAKKINTLCDKWDMEIVYIKDIRNDKTEARGQGYFISPFDGTKQPIPDRWITHPGDLGFKLIAERIIEKLGFED